MKNIYINLFAALILVSCGEQKKNSIDNVLESNNLETIRKKRGELVNEQQAISENIKLLDAKISMIDTTANIPLITTFNTKTEVFKHYLELQGNVTTKDLMIITPEFNGILKQVFVKEGQRVTKGQVLAKIDDGGLGQQVTQLQIQADLAKTTFERQERLWKQNIGSEIQYLQTKSNYEAQQEAVKQLKAQVALTVVTAPFTGTIDEIITEPGNVVGAGQTPLIQIVNLNNMYIETEVPETYVPYVKKGKDVIVNLPVLNADYNTSIRKASDVINPSNRTFKIEVAIPNKDKKVKPNLTAKLKINDYTKENAILIPQSVISENANGEQYVYVVANKDSEGLGDAKRVIITTGKTQGDIIEVTSGIKANTEIILEGARSVRDGQRVEVINYESEK